MIQKPLLTVPRRLDLAIYHNYCHAYIGVHQLHCAHVRMAGKPDQRLIHASWTEPAQLLTGLEDYRSYEVDLWIYIPRVPINRLKPLVELVRSYFQLRFGHCDLKVCSKCLARLRPDFSVDGPIVVKEPSPVRSFIEAVREVAHG